MNDYINYIELTVWQQWKIFCSLVAFYVMMLWYNCWRAFVSCIMFGFFWRQLKDNKLQQVKVGYNSVSAI
jgi:hypothetical protein